ncbi:MAG: glycosyltransferase family 39 protein [Gemmatimonadota bacterium]
MTARPAWVCFLLCLCLGAALRLTGFTRGSSDYLLPEAARQGAVSAFYHFHPDEEMILQAALRPFDPLQPEFTVYGALPVYLLQGALRALAPAPAEGLQDPAFARRAFLVARGLAVLFSCLTLWLTWELGRRYFDPVTACVAAAVVALAPGAVQQAHFYIVDGLFGLLSLAALYAILREAESGRRGWLVAAALLIGATAAVKLTGLALGGTLVAARLLRPAPGNGWRQRLLAPARDRRLWWAAAGVVATLVALEPYLVLAPGRIVQSDVIGDFAVSAAIAQGEILRPWTLADVHTLPYLHHWTHLLPLIAGWPLTLLFAAGLVHALYARSRGGLVLLAWFALHFALIGGLHAKHVRYLIPLLPILALLAAELVARLVKGPLPRPWRLAGLALAAVAAAHGALYGFAFARIYTREDSRIQAARWIHAHLPAGTAIGVEAGGFTLSPLLSRERYVVRPLEEARCFGARRYLTCQAAADHLGRQVRQVEYLAVLDANRYLQFTAVPDLFPAVAAFYRRLLDGSLGFEVVQRFEVPPQLAGLAFAPDRAEPSFLGYDHPTVYLLRRRPDRDQIWDSWRHDLERRADCPDQALAGVVESIRAGTLDEAAWRSDRAMERYPDLLLTPLLSAFVHSQRGEVNADREDRARYAEGCEDPSQNAHLIPWASSLSLIGLGLPELVSTVLQAGRRGAGPEDRAPLAHYYREVGDLLNEVGQPAAVFAYQASVQLAPGAAAYAGLGIALQRQGDAAASAEAYRKALELDPRHATARVNLAWNHYLQGDFAAAIALNRQVLAEGANDVATCNLGLALLAGGDVGAGETQYERAVAQLGADHIQEIGAVADLRAYAERGGGAGPAAARRLLQRHWPTSTPGTPHEPAPGH